MSKVHWLALAAAAFAFANGATAQEMPKKRTPAPPGARLYFIDPKDGQVIQPTTTVRFGLRGVGVAPAGIEKAGTGHHHLLIDVGVPLLDQPIPNDPQHVHFGAGQTEAEVTLTPGEHSLQLLLGDHDHIPHNPPIMSDKIKIVVQADGPLAERSDNTEGKPRPATAKVYFVYPRDGDYIYPTSTIRFGLSEMGVAPAGVEKAGTGHHHLLLNTDLPPVDKPIPNDAKHLHLGTGQTEIRLTLPLGQHTMQLLLGDEEHRPHNPPAASERITVTVRPGGPRGRR